VVCLSGEFDSSLGEFEAAETIKKLNYSFEVESDHQEWDLAVDGIQTMQRQLDELQSTFDVLRFIPAESGRAGWRT
jgi:hypothetical protein